MRKSPGTIRSYSQLLKLWHNKPTTSTRVNYQKLSKCMYSTGVGDVQTGKLPTHQNLARFSTANQDTEVDVPEVNDEPELETVGISNPFAKANIVVNVRTEHNDPMKHTEEDVGLFYTVPQDEYEKIFEVGQWPFYKKQVKTFQECAVMVRKPALEVFQLADNVNLKLPAPRFILYGKNGTGKTMTLAHIVHRYSKDGWLTVHVPDMMNRIRYIKNHERVLQPSLYNEGYYDLPDEAKKWLTYFREQNQTILKDITLSKDYKWSDRYSASAGESLLDIANFGIDRMLYASDIVGVILKEIKQQAASKGIKVLVAVDGVNGLWKNMGGVRDEKKKPINVQKISMFHHLTQMFSQEWTSGVCVGTVCAYVEALDTELSHEDIQHTPQHLLKAQGFKVMDPFIPIQVPQYSTKEAYNYIDYLVDRKWIVRPRGHTEEGRKELVMLTDKNPAEMMNISALW